METRRWNRPPPVSNGRAVAAISPGGAEVLYMRCWLPQAGRHGQVDPNAEADAETETERQKQKQKQKQRQRQRQRQRYTCANTHMHMHTRAHAPRVAQRTTSQVTAPGTDVQSGPCPAAYLPHAVKHSQRAVSR